MVRSAMFVVAISCIYSCIYLFLVCIIPRLMAVQLLAVDEHTVAGIEDIGCTIIGKLPGFP